MRAVATLVAAAQSGVPELSGQTCNAQQVCSAVRHARVFRADQQCAAGTWHPARPGAPAAGLAHKSMNSALGSALSSSRVCSLVCGRVGGPVQPAWQRRPGELRCCGAAVERADGQLETDAGNKERGQMDSWRQTQEIKREGRWTAGDRHRK
eukprot:365151-Chlamydomonas_euryale.AAC.18